MSSPKEPIEIEQHGAVALLRVRAGKANAMNLRLLDALAAALDRVVTAGAVVIVGDGASFSAGLALPELIDLDRAAMTAFMDRFEVVMRHVLAFPRATIAAINGHAVAGGCVLALMCDLRVMAAGPGHIGLNEVVLGIGLPAIVVELLRARRPPASVGAIALEGRLFSPDDALRVQLVDEVVSAAELVPRSLELAASRARAPAAYAQIKQALIAPVLAACDDRRAIDRDAWLETWFSPHAQRTLRATVDRITKR